MYHYTSKVKALHIILSKTTVYIMNYDEQTKWMHFFTEDDDLSEKHSTIWDTVNADIKTNLIASLLTIKIFLKTRIKSHGDEVTDLFNKKIPKVESNHNFFAIIRLDSALKRDENCHLQVFLKECKYIEKKVIREIVF